MDEANQDGVANPTEPLCITCGYDLRSLPTEESCPECGTLIELSLRGDLLSRADPAWVARLARGQSLLVFGVRLCLIVMVCAIGISFLVGFGLGFGLGINIPSWVFSVLFGSVGAALIVGLLVATLGCTLLTTQDPRDSLRESSISNRIVARIALLAMYGGLPASSLALFLPFVRRNPQVLSGIILLVVGACFTVALVATLGWLAALATRIPNHDLRSRTFKSARFFRWAIPVFILLSLIPPLGFAPPPAPGAPLGTLAGSRPMGLFLVKSCVSMIVTLGILLGSVRMYKDMFSYRTALRQCAAEASASNSEPPVTD